MHAVAAPFADAVCVIAAVWQVRARGKDCRGGKEGGSNNSQVIWLQIDQSVLHSTAESVTLQPQASAVAGGVGRRFKRKQEVG